MSGGTKSSSTQQSQQQSSSGSGQAWANPYAVSALNEITDVYNQNKGNLAQQGQQANNLLGQLTKGYQGAQGQAASATAGYNAAQGAGAPASGYYNDVLSGKYLNSNPYLQDVINSTNTDVTNGVNSQFEAGGRYGSGAYAGTLAQQLANADSSLRANDYNTQMTRMDSAAAGQTQDADTRLGIAASREANANQNANAAAGLAMGQQQLAAQLPYTGTNELSQALQALFSGGTSSGTSSGTSTSTQSNGVLGGIGGILSGVGAMGSGGIFASDPELKEGAIRVAEYPDGLGLWEYNYLGSNDREFGVMADEVAELRPWAAGPQIDGFRTVNYEAL